jgi:hypothetical protein
MHPIHGFFPRLLAQAIPVVFVLLGLALILWMRGVKKRDKYILVKVGILFLAVCLVVKLVSQHHK